MTIENYKYRGARAMVILHERHMRSCLEVWKKAKSQNVTLPQTDDTDYDSLEHLLHHVFRAARGYMTWICEVLDLEDPKINEVPILEKIESEADQYIEHLLIQWGKPLINLDTSEYGKMFTSRWGMGMCIEAMIEHALVHPMRHQFQLEELIEKQN